MSGEGNGVALATLDTKMERLRDHFNEQFSGVRSDIKDLTAAMRDLIRLDGDLKRQNDAMIRIGRQVDAHDDRLRTLETSNASTQVKTGSSDRFFWLVITAASSIFTGVIVAMVVSGMTHP